MRIILEITTEELKVMKEAVADYYNHVIHRVYTNPFTGVLETKCKSILEMERDTLLNKLEL